MSHRLKIRCLGCLPWIFLALFAGGARADIIWHWRDSFSQQEKTTLKTWITRTVSAVERLVTPYPFDVHIYFYKSPDAGEPVPWANTRRGRVQGVNFHVNTAFPLQSFLDDWTAPHELSHLLIPTVGKRYSWFAEGFASYMQYQVMGEMGVISPAEVADNYLSHIRLANQNYHYGNLPFDEAASELRRHRQYPTLYWGGAVYFLRADARLQKLNSSLVRLLSKYLECCRMTTDSLPELVSQFDHLSGSEIFSEALRDIKSRRGFPEFQDVITQRDTH